mgnify:CR=1 FL=1
MINCKQHVHVRNGIMYRHMGDSSKVTDLYALNEVMIEFGICQGVIPFKSALKTYSHSFIKTKLHFT